MKYLTTFFLSFTIISITVAQAPTTFNYQGKASLSSGESLGDRSIGLRISIVEGHSNGNEVFSETHTAQTSSTGVFSIRIGEGDNERGSIANINWGSNQFFIKTEIDPNGGNAFSQLGTTQLYSVPYALYAAEAGNAGSGGGGTDGQTLSFSGTTLSIQNGNSVNLSSLRDGVNDADSDPENEIQELSISGNTLSISNGNSVNLPSSSGGGNNTDNQTLSLSSKTLSISGGNSVSLSSISNDADADPDNELQRLSISGDRLSISNGNTINLPSSGEGGSSPWQVDDDEISYDGDQILFKASNIINAMSLSKFDNGSGFLNMSGGNDVGGLSISAFTGYQARDEEDELTHFFFDFDGEGFIQLHNNSTAVVDLGANRDGHGAIYTANKDGKMLVDITSTSSGNEGDLFLYSNEKEALRLAAFESGAGFLSITGTNESEIIRNSVNQGNAGTILTYGPNGNVNTQLNSLSNSEDHGYISVNDSDGEALAGIYVDGNGMGRVFGDMKNFRTPHPNKDNYDIVYASIEGPEAAIYCRGTSKLIDGKAEVILPEHFSLLAAEQSITIMLTPGSARSLGLAATNKTSKKVTIEELHGGKGYYTFDWEVKAVRKGFEDYEVVMHNSQLKSMRIGKQLPQPKKNVNNKRMRHEIK